VTGAVDDALLRALDERLRAAARFVDAEKQIADADRIGRPV